MKNEASKPAPADELKGWNTIAKFLGQPVAVVQRWARDGMPVSRKGRYTTASVQELRTWLGKETGMSNPARFGAASDEGLASDLRESVRVVKRR